MSETDREFDKVCYEQNYQQFRSLNQTMWQVPLLAMTLTGGLWFGTTKSGDRPDLAVLFFGLAAVANVSFIVILARIRYVMDCYLGKIEEFHPPGFVKAPGDGRLTGRHMVRGAFTGVLFLSALASAYAAGVELFKGDEKVEQGIASGAYYDALAERLAEKYESVSFEEVHGSLLTLVPNKPSRILDVGSGSGRDAAKLASLGHKVVSVEPSAGMRRVAEKLHPEVRPVDASLPALKGVDGTFDFILVSAVWMHIQPRDRSPAIMRLAELAERGAVVVVTFRDASPDPERAMHPVDPDLLKEDAAAVSLQLVSEETHGDVLGRGLSWRMMIFRKA